MTPHYPHIWAQLRRVGRFEKYAADSSEAQADLATVADEVFSDFMAKAASYGDGETPEALALKAASFAVDLYDSASATGVKVAGEDVALGNIEQLATVAYLDGVLKAASENLSGADLDEAQRVRLLGREYGIELLRNLVG